MSIAYVRPFLRGRLEGLGYIEHTDAIDFQNIPSTVLDNTFHMEPGEITSGPSNHQAHSYDYELTLRVFKRGFSDPVAAHDQADSDIETILEDLLDPEVRLGVEIKDVVVGSIAKNPLSATDDSDLIIELNLTIKLWMCFGA